LPLAPAKVASATSIKAAPIKAQKKKFILQPFVLLLIKGALAAAPPPLTLLTFCALLTHLLLRLTILEYPVTATATTFIWISNVILIEELSTMKVYKIVIYTILL
jgi:hypothetical protein